MKYAVIFYSRTGNTEDLAEEIYNSIDSYDKVYVDLNKTTDIPEADMYYVGFPIHKRSCSLKIIECLERLTTGKLVLFATCGMRPTDKYKENLEESLTVWIPNSVEYLGMFLCQGRTEESQKEYFLHANPQYVENMKEMLKEGETHPNEEDFERASRYVKQIQELIE